MYVYVMNSKQSASLYSNLTLMYIRIQCSIFGNAKQLNYKLHHMGPPNTTHTEIHTYTTTFYANPVA